MRLRVFISRHVFPEAVEHLRAVADMDYRDASDGLTEAQLAERVRGVDAIVCQLTDPITPRVLEAARRCRIVANVAVGYDNIDVETATRLGIAVTNTPGVLTETTADFAFALLLTAARRVVEGDQFLRAGRFREWQIDLLCGQDIFQRTLGIIGMGRIGQAVARRARGFSMPVLYHNRKRIDPSKEAELNARPASLGELLRESDYVSLHVPLTPETRHLISVPELELMKNTAILINTARGPVVDEAALAEAVINKEIAGAALDVFEREPAVHERLLSLENVVLAPHIASASVATRSLMCDMAAQNVVAAFRGTPPPDLLNPAVLRSGWPKRSPDADTDGTRREDTI